MRFGRGTVGIGTAVPGFEAVVMAAIRAYEILG